MVLHKSSVPFVLLAIAFAAVPAAAEPAQTREFAGGSTRPRTIALLPALTWAKLQRFASFEPLDSTELAAQLTLAFGEALRKKGYDVRIVSAADFAGDGGMEDFAKAADQAFEEWRFLLCPASRRDCIRERRHSTGTAVTELAERLDVDADTGYVEIEMTPGGFTRGRDYQDIVEDPETELRYLTQKTVEDLPDWTATILRADTH